MKIVKRILIAIVVLIALILLIALFVKKDFGAEKEVVVNKPRQEMYQYLRYVKNQDNFSVWNKMDPGMKKSYEGTDGTVGFTYKWEGNSEVGKGEQSIRKLTDGQRIDLDLRFKEPIESYSPAWLVTEEIAPTQTRVKWGMSGRMQYPFNIMCLFMNMDEMVGKDLQTGLNNLKVLMEGK